MPPPPRTGILTIIVILLLLFPDTPQPTTNAINQLEDAVAEETAALSVLNETYYGGFNPEAGRWLNLTGFRQSAGFGWTILDRLKAKAKDQATYALGEQDALAAIEGRLERNLPLYRNVSGYVTGQWSRSRLESGIQSPELNLSTIFPERNHVNGFFNRNITGKQGWLHIRIDEKDKPVGHGERGVQGLRVDMTIADANSAGDGWQMVLYGEHFLDSGSIVLATSSEKFSGLFGLPHLTLSERQFLLAQTRLRRTLRETISKQQSHKLLTLHPWTSSPEGQESLFATPSCDLVVYMQQHLLKTEIDNSPTIVDPATVATIEQELRYPEGELSLSPPRLSMSALIFSPDCGFVLESKGPPVYAPTDGNHLIGAKDEVYVSQGRYHTILFGAVLALQVIVMIREIKDASTPSTRSRISFYTIAMLALGDGVYCMSFLPLGMLSNSTFPTFLATSFMAFLAVTFFDLRFMMDIWAVQSQERRRLEMQRTAAEARSPASSGSPAPSIDRQTEVTNAGAMSQDTLPLPVTARQAVSSGATPITLPPAQDEPAQQNGTGVTATTTAASGRREVSSLYAKFYLILLGTMFLSLHASQWYHLPRTIFTNTLAFIYLSFWLPQIYRNIMRNCRKALLWKFVVGESVLRLVPFVYFYAYPHNLLFVKNDRLALLLLAAWVWIQVCVLIIQGTFGPRLFVPEGWAPPAYDYHPILREDEEDATMPIGFSQAQAPGVADDAQSPTLTRRPTESKDKRKRVFDCAICMQDIEVPVVPRDSAVETSAGSALMGSFLERRNYMVTPCRHIFHTPCLEAAMRYRLECPNCRASLPPL